MLLDGCSAVVCQGQRTGLLEEADDTYQYSKGEEVPRSAEHSTDMRRLRKGEGRRSSFRSRRCICEPPDIGSAPLLLLIFAKYTIEYTNVSWIHRQLREGRIILAPLFTLRGNREASCRNS